MDEVVKVSRAEADRLEALYRYDILDTPSEPRFDRIVRMASRLLDMPISLVSLLDEARQWFKAKVGIDASETPRSVAFCDHAIRQDQVMVVEDAEHDRRFVKNPLVTNDPKVRFYAGAPLKTSEGHRLGTLCVIDRVPRKFSTEQRVLLEDLAALVVDEMELRWANLRLLEMATTDPLTRLLNRRRFFALAEVEWERAHRYGRPLSFLTLDIDRFKSVNDTYGHDAGDKVLVGVARLCAEQKRPSDIAARFGGEEFAILMPETDLAGAYVFAERLRIAIERNIVSYDDSRIVATASIGITEAGAAETLGELMKIADNALYEAKDAGRNRVHGYAAALAKQD